MAAEEGKAKKGKEEKKPGKAGGLITKIVIAVLGLLLLAAVGLGVYIFVLPDDLPKPFYVCTQPPAEVAAEAPGTPAPAESNSPETGSDSALPMPGEGLMFDTGTKIVNLADPGGRRYLKISLVLEFAPQEAAFHTLAGEERAAAIGLFNEEFSVKKPIVDDMLNTLLSSKTFEEIYTVDGKELLRQDIIARTNALLPADRLMYVYFTEFVVQ